jgi:peptide/nickel transport system substrate-binding protein
MTFLRSLIFTALAAIILAGCGNGGPDTSNNTFFYNDPDGLNTLDPAKIGARAPWWVGSQIFAGLVGLDSALQPVPLLAKSWTVSEDGRVWTFTLRTDAFFSDDAAFTGGKGRRLIAEDVRYSFERICTPATASTGFWVFRGKVKGAEEFFAAREKTLPNAPEHVEGFRVVNDSTFQIELTEPFAPFLSMLSIPYCYIVPREVVEKYGADFFRHPVGAGAFHLVEWLPDQRLVLARNASYFETDGAGTRLPYLDTIQVSFIKSLKTEFIEFKQGNLDMISSIDPEFAETVLADDGKSLRADFGDYRLSTAPAMSVEYYGFMLDAATPGGSSSPFTKNRYLRQALNYAIDRDAIIRYVLKGRAISGTHGPVPPGTPGFSGVKGYGYDRELARRLLDSAGYPNGKGLGQITLQLGPSERTASVAEAVQDQLKKTLGIDLKLVQVDFPQHREMILSGKLPFWRTSWIGDYPDAENFLALFYSPYAAPRGPNTTHFSSSGVDSLYRAALDPRLSTAERAALYGEAERIILENAPWVILYYNVIQRLTQPTVTNYWVDPLDRLVLTRVRKQAAKQ